MSPKPMARPGGRSARVQESVHAAVRELEAEQGRAALSVPAIAARAGVTPSTIYRRWGDLRELLSDVAVERLRPEEPPVDHGSLHADLTTWAQQFLEEMGSPSGRAYIRDALLGDPDGSNAGQCSVYAADQVEAILSRALGRAEAIPTVEVVMDHVVAPMMYRILFRPGLLGADYAEHLVHAVLTALDSPSSRRGPQ
ncbi:TetR/AcrR family transcriptional regulator [Streptomyces zagrosensis]|uniref:AcrR family transcriptional regulator n=1 Tax=Streptomyces zagrosensis TaxID=1042984 RepID=A0A7W9UZB8_9ACTN|nr:TetR/AcrR family transcriptional regulator [Streptomyces zagrosensis]MBB5936572.1 AcrR family transcriptional regulator [Streptomyces zagrosensis]